MHRVASILDEDPRTIRTKGDANPASIPGTDFPITDEEYIGKVAYTLPQVGYITQLLKPPINYVIIAIVIGIMIVKQFSKRKKEKELSLEDPMDSDNPDTIEELADIDKIEEDAEYSEPTELGNVEENEDSPETISDESTEHSEKSEEEKKE